MTRRRARKGGVHPGAAVFFLIVSVALVGMSLRGTFGSGSSATPDGAAAGLDGELEPMLPATQAAGTPGVDLLEKHGSWQAGGAVRMAFATLAEAAVGAAPAVETSPVATGRWVGADPPALQVGVLMVGSKVRRAVVEGAVVGIGERIGEARVVNIERDVMRVLWMGQRLTYDLEGVHPREFRGELSRRAVAATDGEGRGDAKKDQEERK